MGTNSEFKLLPTEELEVETQVNRQPIAEDFQNVNAQPVPMQNQLPADSYKYANTTQLGNAINTAAEKFNVDPHKLEALTGLIKDNKVNLSGYYDLQVGYWPGMPAESLAMNLARVMDMAATHTETRRQNAKLNGEQFNEGDFDRLLDSLQSIDGKKSGRQYFEETFAALQEQDHMQWDNPDLAVLYESYIDVGKSKAEAWSLTMDAQDKFRAAQDQRTIMQDFNNMVTPGEMENYVAGLAERVQNETNAELKIRTYKQYELAKKLASAYSTAAKNDPAGYLMEKDPVIKSFIDNNDMQGALGYMQQQYDAMKVPESQRKYLSNAQADALASEINTFINEEPAKAQQTLAGMVQTYGSYFGVVFNQLVREKKVSESAQGLVEALRTNAPASNELVLTMFKNKAALGNTYTKTLLNAPDEGTAKTMRQKVGSRIYALGGYKALVNNFDMQGDIQGKIRMAEFYTDLAVLIKSQNPGLSDKQVAEKVQEMFIDPVYAYDAAGRVILPKKNFQGAPIEYSGYTPEQAVNYLSTLTFNRPDLVVGSLSKEVSANLLSSKSNIIIRALPNTNDVQPMYIDANGNTQAIFKVDSSGNKTLYKINLGYLGQEQIYDTFVSQDNCRKLLNTAMRMVNTNSSFSVQTGLLDSQTKDAYDFLLKTGFKLKGFDNTKPFSQQLNRLKLSPERTNALSMAMAYQKQYEDKLVEYRTAQKELRQINSPAEAGKYIGAFLTDMLPGTDKKMLSDWMEARKQGKVELQKKKQETEELRQQLYKIESDFIKSISTFLDYKGELPTKPFTKEIEQHKYLDQILWGGY